jgi:NADH dehydrogenase [ubiquinone] 1 alpha subcomplex assembly factor 5
MPPMTLKAPPRIFNRTLLQLRRRRAAKHFAEADFLHRAVALDLVDRLESIARSFERVLAIGPGAHLVKALLTPKAGVKQLDCLDPLAGDKLAGDDFPICGILTQQGGGKYAAILSIMDLHMMDDPLAALIAMRLALKPDGVMMAALPGENTLRELRDCLYAAESEILGGVSPRLVPMAPLKSLGALLQRAGFALPVADKIAMPVHYKNPMRLLHDLRAMGETAPLVRTAPVLRRAVLARAMALYAEKYGEEKGARASFDIVMLTGWAPHSSQQKPLKPGSATHSLAQAVLGTDNS